MSEEMQGPDHPAFETLKTGFHSYTRVSVGNTCRCSVMLLSITAGWEIVLTNKRC